MRINRIRGRGFISFPGDFDIDLDAMNGEVSAVVGANGAGKSTLLEITAGAVIALNKKFLQTPTRGPLKDLAVTRDAFIEVTFEYEKHYIVKHSIDAKTGKIETSITCDGAPVLQKGQVSEYLTWAMQTLPPAEVFYASLFAAQGAKGLLGMKEGPRKETILRVLGLERLEKLAKCARDRAAVVSAELSGVRARISELESTRTLEEYTSEVLRLADSTRRAEETLRLGELTVKDLRGKNEAIASQRTAYNALLTRRAELESQESKLTARIAELDTLIANNSGLLDTADEIRAAAVRMIEIESAVDELEKEAASYRVKEVEIGSDLRQIEAGERTADEKATELQERMEQLNTLIAGADAARSAASSIPDFEESLKETEHERDSAEAAFEALQEKATTRAGAGREFLRGELRHIADGKAEDPVAYAGSALSADDLAEKEVAERPGQILNAKAAWQQARDRASEFSGQISKLRLEAAKLDEITAAIKSRNDASDALTQVGRDLVALSTQKTENAIQRGGLLGQMGATNTTKAGLTEEVASLKVLAGRAAPLAEAETKIAAYREERERLASDREGLLELLSKVITDAVEPPRLINIAAEEMAVDGARTDLSNCQAALAVAQRELTNAEEKERRREELTVQSQGLEEKQSDLTRLAQDLGKDGLQALEIAAAGSEITTLANDLLQSAGDPRTVSVETVHMDSTGKRELEGCEITVMESGKPDKTAEQLSGGEGVFVGEALSLAMVMVGCRRSASSSPTIVRDESGSALDAGHGPMYVAMLRRAAEIVGAARVLFVSHSPELQALADSTISIEGGVVSVA